MSAPDPVRQRLLLVCESSMHLLVRQEMTRDEAIDIKNRMSVVIGILNKRFRLNAERDSIRGGPVKVVDESPRKG